MCNKKIRTCFTGVGKTGTERYAEVVKHLMSVRVIVKDSLVYNPSGSKTKNPETSINPRPCTQAAGTLKGGSRGTF
jgi:hypothetical protein